MSSSSSYENLVTNGDFDGNAVGWILSGGMRYESGKLVAEPPVSPTKKAIQSISLILGNTYLVSVTIAKTGVEVCSFSLGGQSVTFDNQDGELTAVITASNHDPLVISVFVQTGIVYIDNVSVQRFIYESSSSSSSSSSSLSSKSTSSSSWIKTSSSSSSQTVSISSSSLSISSLSSSSTSSSISISSESSKTESYSSVTSISSSSSLSSSSLSSSSISSSSSSTLSSSSKSSSSSFSSHTSSSSVILSSSSSLSSLSSSSSSSSINKGYYLLPFTLTASNDNPIWCFIRNEEYVYAGTGPYGKVIRSKDFQQWDDFVTVDDNHVKSMNIWANGLFMGTEPRGRIYVYNFSSENFYCYVETEDREVSCLITYNGYLYAGTKPQGIIYKFDGSQWTKIYNSYGLGVTSMTVVNNLLYVFMDGAETGVVFDGENWTKLKITQSSVYTATEVGSSSSSSSSTVVVIEESTSSEIKLIIIDEEGIQVSKLLPGNAEESLASYRKVKAEPFLVSRDEQIDRTQIGDVNELIRDGNIQEEDKTVVVPIGNISSILSSCADSTLLYIGGNNGAIYSYASTSLKSIFQTDLTNVNKMISLKDNTLIVAIDNYLYIIKNEGFI